MIHFIYAFLKSDMSNGLWILNFYINNPVQRDNTIAEDHDFDWRKNWFSICIHWR